MKALFLSFVTMFMLLAPGERLHAQWRVPRAVLGCGGNTMTGVNYTISSTLGQTIIGRANAGTDRAQFGFWHTYSSITVPVDSPPGEPAAFELRSFPNPCSGSATIQFTLRCASTVVLEAYDPLGRKLGIIADGFFEAGRHDIGFNAQDAAARSAARTLYVVMKTSSYTHVLPITVLGR